VAARHWLDRVRRRAFVEVPPAAGAAAVGDTGSPPADAGPFCPADAFEPNDDPSAATLVGVFQPVEALLCSDADVDYYRFAAPAVGTSFSVRVRFVATLGDIDIALISAADGAVVDESASVIGEEVVSAVARGDSVRALERAFADVRLGVGAAQIEPAARAVVAFLDAIDAGAVVGLI